MVKEYLEKIRQELLEEQVVIQKREKELQNHLKENIKFIQLLEETNDPNYAAFTPREVNGHNQKKIEELKEEQKEINRELQETREKSSDLIMRLDEVSSVIRVAKEESIADLGSMEGQSSNFRKTILEIQETERQRIARDLHDSTVQNLTSLVHKSELCVKLMDVDPIRCRLELSSLSKTLRDVIEDTRNMIYDLRPMSFDDIGFDTTVERYLDKLKSGISTKFTYEVEGEPYKIDNVIQLTLLRIIQEACSNAVKHARAYHVKVCLNYKENSLGLSIEDDGEGFDTSSIPERTRDDNSGFGLSMMKERVYLLSGKLYMKSEVGKGCKIIVEIPIKEEG